ncbi:unnamed protein product [Linum trigynum]|uniref:Uncharacterized protein n=1 Tax=Linum trigynum TaxID=586398 RepID=A0AAV2DFC5_9ROSI
MIERVPLELCWTAPPMKGIERSDCETTRENEGRLVQAPLGFLMLYFSFSPSPRERRRTREKWGTKTQPADPV